MIYILQHVDFEPPGLIHDWFEKSDKQYKIVSLHRGDPLPDPSATDGLIIMGGPMSVYDDAQYSWLKNEKTYIKECIQSEKKVLGICLGSQFLASVLGAKVKRNHSPEIGWFPLEINVQNLQPELQPVIPNRFTTFHWHGDTFDIPDGAIPFAFSEGCSNQGFVYNKNVLALQFHLEMDQDGLELLISNCGDELLSKSHHVQNADDIRKGASHIAENKRILFNLLGRFFH